MKCLEYPFDSSYILKKKKSIKRELLASGSDFIDKRVAVLGGSTTAEIRNILELFLLNYGIKPDFYESGYAGYWNEAMFGDELRVFNPDIVFIHTASRNITTFPEVHTGKEQADEMLEGEFYRFSQMWDKLLSCGYCVIQNNFERPFYRLLGNKDISDYRGRSNFISRLNSKLYEYAQHHDGFYINDIDYISAWYGLEKWHDLSAWYMYKYALSIPAIPLLAYNTANIIKAVYGKNKKALILDLDNTLWGGVIGDDGTDGIELGIETASGEAYLEFQKYIKSHINIGIPLAICSKNDEENAIAGLRHPNSVLSPEDFVEIKANWDNKDRNVTDIANKLNLGIDSLVFIDDNPAERNLVAEQLPGIDAPDIGSVEDYIKRIDMSGFFETVSVTADDAGRAEMYKENVLRTQAESKFENYDDYLQSLKMQAIIQNFEPVHIGRITQLINKTNQFNLTTKRYTESEIKAIAADDRYIRLCGSLKDKFGDNGIVSVIIGRKEGNTLHIDLWIMSCRVFKRNMEFAMFDVLVDRCHAAGISKMIGYYYPAAKNSIVKDIYDIIGFVKVNEDEKGNTVWELDVSRYKPKDYVIKTINI